MDELLKLLAAVVLIPKAIGAFIVMLLIISFIVASIWDWIDDRIRARKLRQQRKV